MISRFSARTNIADATQFQLRYKRRRRSSSENYILVSACACRAPSFPESTLRWRDKNISEFTSPQSCL